MSVSYLKMKSYREAELKTSWSACRALFFSFRNNFQSTKLNWLLFFVLFVLFLCFFAQNHTKIYHALSSRFGFFTVLLKYKRHWNLIFGDISILLHCRLSPFLTDFSLFLRSQIEMHRIRWTLTICCIETRWMHIEMAGRLYLCNNVTQPFSWDLLLSTDFLECQIRMRTIECEFNNWKR